MYIYFDDDNYVIGYGSDFEEGSIEVEFIPAEVDKYLGAYMYDKKTGKYSPDEDRKTYLESRWSAEKELIEKEDWFKWYDQQCMQYLRETRLGQKSDKNIDELDAQAVKNAEDLKALRVILATPYSQKEKEETK